MKRVTLKAVVDQDLCIGCKVCEKVCPVYAISVTGRKAHSDSDKCMACANCVDVSKFDYEKIRTLCEKAHLNPEQVVCYCVGTRAEEIAAALLAGATTPEEVSAMTGARTGCTIECIQPVLRLIQAAGNELHPNPDGWQWYGVTVTAWDIPEEVKEKYNSRGFYFDEDRELLDKIVKVRTDEEA